MDLLWELTQDEGVIGIPADGGQREEIAKDALAFLIEALENSRLEFKR